MKYIKHFLALLALSFFAQCSEKSIDEAVTGPALDKVIEDKYKQLGWDMQNTTKVGNPEKTKGGGGYVQYYSHNGRKRAIYLFGDEPFGLDPDLVEKYDAIGQETFTALGPMKSGTKICGSGCIYVEFKSGLIIKSTASTKAIAVSGAIYEKYVTLSKWEGVLGYPQSDEWELRSKKGWYNEFQKGQIYWSKATGAQAFWGKTMTLYGRTDWDMGWLGMPIRSTQYYSGNRAYITAFEKGDIGIEDDGCGFFLSNTLLNADGHSKKVVLIDGKTVDTARSCY